MKIKLGKKIDNNQDGIESPLETGKERCGPLEICSMGIVLGVGDGEHLEVIVAPYFKPLPFGATFDKLFNISGLTFPGMSDEVSKVCEYRGWPDRM